jgi:hypothetical protein
MNDARTVFDPSCIRCELIWGDETIWQTFLETLNLGHFKGRTLIDFSPFHAIAPQHLKRTKKVSLSLVWVIERLRGVSLSQPIILKPGAFVFLQDTFHTLCISNLCLPSMFGMIGGMACTSGYPMSSTTSNNILVYELLLVVVILDWELRVILEVTLDIGTYKPGSWTIVVQDAPLFDPGLQGSVACTNHPGLFGGGCFK